VEYDLKIKYLQRRHPAEYAKCIGSSEIDQGQPLSSPLTSSSSSFQQPPMHLQLQQTQLNGPFPGFSGASGGPQQIQVGSPSQHPQQQQQQQHQHQHLQQPGFSANNWPAGGVLVNHQPPSAWATTSPGSNNQIVAVRTLPALLRD
jgi:hypothetical protein